MEIKGKTILVSGGAGFVGSHIVDALLNEGAAKVIVYDNFASGSTENVAHHKANMVEIIQGDILDYKKLLEVMKGVDIVSHQAAQLEIFHALDDPFDDLKTNLHGTLNILKASLECKVQKVINASSACVYGQARYIPQNEDHPLRPQWPYGVSKLSAEKYGLMFYEFYGLPVVSLRYGIVYGPREWYGRVLPTFIKRIFDNKPPVIFGDGNQSRDFVFVSDVARAHNACITEDNANGEVYNVGTGIKTTVRQIAELAVRSFEKNLSPVFERTAEGEFSKLMTHRRRIPGELQNMVLDNSKARRELNWKPDVDLEKGIQAEVSWFKGNPNAWDDSAPKI